MTQMLTEPGPTPRAAITENGRLAVELCAGLGGIGIGLRALGFRIAKAYDSWGEAVATYSGIPRSSENRLTESAGSIPVAW